MPNVADMDNLLINSLGHLANLHLGESFCKENTLHEYCLAMYPFHEFIINCKLNSLLLLPQGKMLSLKIFYESPSKQYWGPFDAFLCVKSKQFCLEKVR